MDHENHNVISILVITKPQFYEYPVTIALVYRSPNSPIASFLDQLVYFTNARTIDILVRDFNIDVFDGDAYTRLHEVLSSYRLMVKEPTHLDEGLLDHVYLLKSLPSMNVNSYVKIIYFSDHDANKLQILAEANDEIDFKKAVNTAAKHNMLLEIMCNCHITLWKCCPYISTALEMQLIFKASKGI